MWKTAGDGESRGERGAPDPRRFSVLIHSTRSTNHPQPERGAVRRH